MFAVVGFDLGKWNFVLGLEIHLASFLLGFRFEKTENLFIQRELTIFVPTVSITLSWIDDENVEKMESAHSRLEDLEDADKSKDDGS